MDSSSLGDLELYDPERINDLPDEKQQPQYNEGQNLVGAPATPPSPQATSIAFYDPLDWNIAQLSPVGSESISSDRTSSFFRNESNPVNAVHMHVQENARIPNYNRPVDRSNSSIDKPFLPRNFFASDLPISTNRDQENSMAEIFLKSEHRYRRSLNQSYEVIGALSTEDNLQREIDELGGVSVDPTPWSEIENKMHIEEKQEQQHQRQRQQPQLQEIQQEAQMSRTVTTTAPAPGLSVPALAPAPVPELVDHPHQSSYYPYGRHHQLPIPERSSPLKTERISPPFNNTTGTASQGVSGLAAAIATAAAIVCTNNDVPNAIAATTKRTNADLQTKENTTTTETVKALPTTSAAPVVNIAPSSNPRSIARQPGKTIQSITKASPQPTTTTKLQTNSTSTNGGIAGTFPNGHLQRQRAYVNPPPHSAAHAVSRASVLAATNRKSQYGFGGNHMVPSVPAPPSVRSVSKSITFRQPKQITTKKEVTVPAVPSSIKPQIPSAGSPPSAIPNSRHPILPIVNNNGSAYERKKQKAKDARVKLNESIERLSIAVSLAGSQSRSRIDQLESEIATTEFRQKSIQVNQEGIRLAENAKKWDRPSFVGTAASVIQSLNAQCEALMAELVAMQRLLDAARCNNEDNNSDINCKNQSERPACVDDIKLDSLPSDETNVGGSDVKIEESESSSPNPSHKRHEQPVDLVQNDKISNKRPRVDTKEAKKLPSKEEIIYGEVAKMLDPMSLCRCTSVSKLWKEMKAFKDDGMWLSLAVNRFGFYNVRHWSENLKDGEDEDYKISNKQLYKKMNAANVMPHFSQEGLSLLGSGKIPGKISGWAFLVERSNGETLRSVRRDPNSGASGLGTYQSRPVVELRIVVQNTGMASRPVILKSQKIGVDVSTRRRGGEFEEISWDDRFKKLVKNMDGRIRPATKVSNNGFNEELCRLELFEAAVLEVHINARGCSTISKFQQRSNFTKVLVSLDGTTVPMVIPFLKLE